MSSLVKDPRGLRVASSTSLDSLVCFSRTQCLPRLTYVCNYKANSSRAGATAHSYLKPCVYHIVSSWVGKAAEFEGVAPAAPSTSQASLSSEMQDVISFLDLFPCDKSWWVDVLWSDMQFYAYLQGYTHEIMSYEEARHIFIYYICYSNS